jgi:kynureninase
MSATLEECRERDAQDPLRGLRGQFDLPAGVIYLDGNSLGPLPRTTAERVRDLVEREWGQGLITSWNTAGWWESPRRRGDKIARLVGAKPGDLLATDATSINLFKVFSAALNIAAADAPGRRRIVSERSNFPTDLYIAEALCRERSCELALVEEHEVESALSTDVAVLMLTHVNYRTGSMHDMARVTAAAHAKGILCIWDLAHSAGAVPVDLQAADADFAVGCGYKYLNGGPGAPAFVWVHPRHVERSWQPLAGWWGHASPFDFSPQYRPAPGIARYLCGSQPVIQLAALECGVDTLLAAEPMGGVQALRRKSLALTDLFIGLVETRCAGHGFSLVTPREHARRGSQVCLAREEGGYAIVQALIARGVIGDYRAGQPGRDPDILRFGFTPLYLGFEDTWHAAEHLRQVMESGEWRECRFNQRQAVT